MSEHEPILDGNGGGGDVAGYAMACGEGAPAGFVGVLTVKYEDCGHTVRYRGNGGTLDLSAGCPRCAGKTDDDEIVV